MDSNTKTAQLAIARSLVTALEQNDEQAAKHALIQLTHANQSTLFNEIGKLTRNLHEALNDFQIDSRLIALTEKDIPDTRDRLNYVIETTESAAHQTLELIENVLPLANELENSAAKLHESWLRFRSREMNAAEFRVLSREIESYLPTVSQHSAEIHQHLSEMTQVQGFQDLTGQVLRQVIKLVTEVEANLVRLVKLAGTQQDPASSEIVDPLLAEGPQINAQNKTNVVKNQDEVDDLLSSLGF